MPAHSNTTSSAITSREEIKATVPKVEKAAPKTAEVKEVKAAAKTSEVKEVVKVAVKTAEVEETKEVKVVEETAAPVS